MGDHFIAALQLVHGCGIGSKSLESMYIISLYIPMKSAGHNISLSAFSLKIWPESLFLARVEKSARNKFGQNGDSDMLGWFASHKSEVQTLQKEQKRTLHSNKIHADDAIGEQSMALRKSHNFWSLLPSFPNENWRLIPPIPFFHLFFLSFKFWRFLCRAATFKKYR